jgi:pyruvate/2-oxoglutarate dehydrogenase complex dihydrolipoamide acyltransferase (E2) component
MASNVLMPKLGLTMTEGTIEEWKHREGDAVRRGEVLFSVATDKLTNDVEAEEDGVLLKILLGAGETAECGAVVARLGQSGETDSDAPDSLPAPAAEKPGPAAPAPAPKPAATAAPAASGRIRVSPYARRSAVELGVDLSALTGTGPCGRIVWRDVSAAAAAAKRKKAKAESGTAAGLYTTADVTELLSGLATLDSALTLEQFVAKAASALSGDVAVRGFHGVEGVLPELRGGETAALGFGEPTNGKLRLNLVYVPSALADDAAVHFLRRLAATLENPLSLLL